MSVSSFLDTYLRHRPLFLSLIRARESELYQKYLPLPSPTLDLGCGDGFFAKTTFGRLDIGLDLEHSRINQAQLGKTYQKLVTYDGVKIPLKTASVQTVVSNCVLEHVDNLSAVLQETYRVLQPKGQFIITVMAHPWEENLVGSMLLGSAYKNWMRRKQVHVNLLTYKEWQTALKNAGFKISYCEGYLSPMTCRLLDIGHYFSLPSLLIYMLFGRWTISSRVNLYPTGWLAKIISDPVEPQEAGALFFVLAK